MNPQGGRTPLTTQAWVPRPRSLAIPSREGFRPQEPNDFPWVKPREGGMWTSTLHPEYGSGWIQWCISEQFGHGDHDSHVFPIVTLEPDPAARIYEVDLLDDLKALIHAYPTQDDRQSFRFLSDRYPDWMAVAEDYDGVHLTERGQWETRLNDPNLYGWDCESTLWFRWSFTAVENLGPVVVDVEDPWWEAYDDDVVASGA